MFKILRLKCVFFSCLHHAQIFIQIVLNQEIQSTVQKTFSIEFLCVCVLKIESNSLFTLKLVNMKLKNLTPAQYCV